MKASILALFRSKPALTALDAAEFGRSNARMRDGHLAEYQARMRWMTQIGRM
ncbi:MAG: hypothetical protein ACU0CO_00925 [Shimia sp.]